MNTKVPPVIQDHRQEVPPLIPRNITPPPVPPFPSSWNNPVTPRKEKVQLVIPWRKCAILGGVLIAGIVAIFFASAALKKIRLLAHQDKVEFVSTLSTLSTNEHDAAKMLCTDAGYRVWTEVGSVFPGKATGYEVTDVNVTGGVAEVAMVRNSVKGVSRLHYILVENGTSWKFKDIYIQTVNDRELGLHASFVIEHPFLANARLYAPELKEIYTEIKGGLKEGTEALGDIATIVSALNGF